MTIAKGLLKALFSIENNVCRMTNEVGRCTLNEKINKHTKFEAPVEELRWVVASSRVQLSIAELSSKNDGSKWHLW